MFDFVTKHKRLLQAVLLVLIVPPFAFFGIQGLDRMVSGASHVAEVDGSKISLQEFSRAMDQQREQLRGVLGQSFDPALLDTPAARKQILNNLIAQRVMTAYLARNHISVSEDQVRDLILAEPAFADEGKFSRARYQSFLRSQNESEVQFEARLRTELAIRRLTGGLVESGFAPKAVAERVGALRTERREVAEAVIPASDFTARVKLSADAVEQYYRSHPQEFERPEQIRVEYVVLTQDALIAQESVTPDDVKKAYESTMAPRARERAEARKKAEALLAEVRKDPTKFADLAKANSQDPGSAAQGGDLDWFARGALVKPFEDAAFKLKENEVGPLVASEFGFHIIQLTGIRKTAGKEERRARHILISAPPEVKSFEAARADIERDLKRDNAAKKYPELAVSISNYADDQSDALQPVADKFKLKLTTTDWFSRQAPPPPLNTPRVAQTLFSDDAIRSKRNSEALEATPGTLVVTRVIDHKPAAVRPLEEVRAEITKKLTADEALKLAQQAGEEHLKALQSGDTAKLKWSASRTVSRENPGGVDSRAVALIMRAETAKLPAYVGVELAPTGYVLYRVSKVIPAPAPDEAKARASQLGLARQEAREAYEAFMTALHERAEIEVNEENLVKK